MLVPCALLATLLAADPLPVVTVDRDNVEITDSCTLVVPDTPIADADGNGVIHITGSNLVVEMAADQRLRGTTPGARPDTCAGIGIVVTGENVTLRDLRVSGYRVGVHARDADHLTIDGADVSDGFRQHLKSTRRAEDASDWLWPHANDANEWTTNYGAGLWIEDASEVTVRGVRARDVQNGIILDGVTGSTVADCDCSFLSGWGLAMWRSSRNVIARNAFDFCVRGYSHEVYNRGQDSAGILMFEQCTNNLIAENSATHGGDGLFGFAGREALGEVNPREDRDWYLARGNANNVIVGNDFSDAAAHGLEMTFSHANHILDNRFVNNAICGIWAGYSSGTTIVGNDFERNGAMGAGDEGGGINIEHGRLNTIRANTFVGNSTGVHLWWDEDPALLALPWATVNPPDSDGNTITGNAFTSGAVGIRLRRTTDTRIGDNTMVEVGTPLDADAWSTMTEVADRPRSTPELAALPGTSTPVGARAALAGREHIIMTEWGPWDHESPLLRLAESSDETRTQRYELLGVVDPGPMLETSTSRDGMTFDLTPGAGGIPGFTVGAPDEPGLYPYTATLTADGHEYTVSDTIFVGNWIVILFPSAVDPRDDYATWRAGSQALDAIVTAVPRLHLRYGNGGPSQAHLGPHIDAADLPKDQFGTVAMASLVAPSGRYRITVTSDDGVRVTLNDEVVIDDWTWHAPKTVTYELEITERERSLNLIVEHFELDGYAVLEVDIDRIED